MNTALIVIFSIVIVCQIILFAAIIWATREEKKYKGKNDLETDIYLTENKCYEIDKEIHKLEAEFKCVRNRLDYLNYKKKDRKLKEFEDGKEER